MATQIQVRRDTATNWTSNAAVLANGEIGFEIDTNKFKIGANGTDWANLAYAGGSELGNALTDINSITAESGADLSLVTDGAVLVQGGGQIDAVNHSLSVADAYAGTYQTGEAGNTLAFVDGNGLIRIDTNTEITALVGIGTSAPQVTFSGVTGANADQINGQVFYLGPIGADDGYNFELWLDAGLSQPTNVNLLPGIDDNTGALLYDFTAGGYAEFKLNTNNHPVMTYNNTAFLAYVDGADLFLAPSGLPVMPMYSSVAGLPGGSAGSFIMVQETNKPAYYDGTNWRYFNDDTIVT